MLQKQDAKLSTISQPKTIGSTGKKSKKRHTTSFVDLILEAAQQQQEQENKEIFLTQVSSQSVLPPIKLNDDIEYKKLMSQNKNIPYLISKHVRQASERQKLGNIDNTHYRHYEKQDLMEVLHQKVKPSEKTLNYVVKFKDHKPSLELMKTVNRGLDKELQKNDQISKEIAEETFKLFGMNNEDREDVGAMIQEESDTIEQEPKEIKFTEHQTEFRNICSKVNKEKSAEIFLRFNDKYSQWNLKDKFAKVYFLSRAASKEPRDFIEKEIQEKKMNQQYENYYKKHNEKYKVDNQLTPKEQSIEEEEQLINMEDMKMLDAQYAEDYGSSSNLKYNFESKRGSQESQQKPPFSAKTISQDQEVNDTDEDDDNKKFIFLEKLKYQNAIKGYDRTVGLKQTLFEFEDKLMDKLFSKREPSNEYKFILKKQNNISKQDKTKPMYMDDLKRLHKFKEYKGRTDMDIREVGSEVFHKEIEQIKQEESERSQVQQKKFKTKWYLRPSQWNEEVNKGQNNNEMPPIGSCTKQAIESFFKPYRELKKRTKEANLEDDYIAFMQKQQAKKMK